MVAPHLRRVEATVGRDRVALAAPALLLVKPAAVTPVQPTIRFIQQLDAGKPFRIFLAVETRNDKPELKTVSLRQRLAVHFGPRAWSAPSPLRTETSHNNRRPREREQW